MKLAVTSLCIAALALYLAPRTYSQVAFSLVNGGSFPDNRIIANADGSATTTGTQLYFGTFTASLTGNESLADLVGADLIVGGDGLGLFRQFSDEVRMTDNEFGFLSTSAISDFNDSVDSSGAAANPGFDFSSADAFFLIIDGATSEYGVFQGDPSLYSFPANNPGSPQSPTPLDFQNDLLSMNATAVIGSLGTVGLDLPGMGSTTFNAAILIPEPSSFALVASLLAMSLFRRRR